MPGAGRGVPGADLEAPPAAYAAALACLPAVGPGWLVEVLAQQSPKAAWELVRSGELCRPSRSRLSPGGPDWSEAACRLDVGSLWAYCQRGGIAVAWPGTPGYPSALRSGPAPAGVLFSRGSVELLEGRPCVALIGTRRCTPEGREVAYQLGYDLCAAGVVVVSGLALGIDGAAHAGALAALRDARTGAGPGRALPARPQDRTGALSARPLELPQAGSMSSTRASTPRCGVKSPGSGQSYRRRRRGHRRRPGGSRPATASLRGWRKWWWLWNATRAGVPGTQWRRLSGVA